MSTPRPHITLTGVDTQTADRAIEILGKSAEIGFLYSATNQGNRYPELEWSMTRAEMIEHAALHVCGLIARKDLIEGRLVHSLGPFKRVQVNGPVDIEYVEELLAKDFMRGKHVITQYVHGREWMAEKFIGACHQVLIDASGGKGITPPVWPNLKTTKAVGFAGGLGIENLRRELEKIIPIRRHEWWIDMESKLRDAHDWFDPWEALNVLELFKRQTEGLA